jgi:hypothetical protein
VTLGIKSHEFIGGLLGTGLREAATTEIARLAGVAVDRDLCITHRQATRARLRTDAHIYFRHFAPTAAWTLVGWEVRAGSCRLDLVWRDEAGRVWADELKTGRFTKLDQGVSAQVERQLEGGARRWGPAFAGVRLCLFGAPNESPALTPAGHRLSGSQFPR